MPLAPGSRLGAYEILCAIGAGGMGEVYRARDLKLGREVALKVLPEAFALDPDRLARFKREAQVLASLDHPNIGAIYGFEDSDGVHALVLQLIEGPTLADRIAEGAIPIEEALPIARQIAEALEAAHDKGVIHRDLKPANVKVMTDGQVKVLDFGLAKLLDTEIAASSQARGDRPAMTDSPTITTPAMTMAGVILGTAAYMAPEQAKGRAADKRSDIWAFGCVFYEMLTGKRAYQGDDVGDTFAAILRGEPNWEVLPIETPSNITTLVKRCLHKDPQKRVAHIAVARYEMDESSSVHGAPPVGATPMATPTWRWVIPVMAGIMLGSVMTWWATRSRALPAIVTRFALMLPEGEQITDPQHRSIAISRDGARIVYVANRRFHLRSMSDPVTRELATELSPAGGPIGSPAFSPDGRSIVYVAGRGGAGVGSAIKKIDLTGGTPTVLADVQSNNVLGLSWNDDDILFADSSRGLVRVSATSGKQQVLIPPSAGEAIEGPTLLPGGDVALFAVATRRGPGASPTADVWDSAKIVALRLRTGERKTLIEGGSDPRYLSTGQLLYAVGGTMFIVPFDVKRLEVTGERTPILSGVARTMGGRTATGMAQFSASETGSAVYIAGPTSAAVEPPKVVLVDRTGRMEALKLPSRFYERPRVSPDGKQLAFGSEEAGGNVIWTYDLSGHTAMRQLTFEGKNQYPIWSADGQHIAFQSDREGDGAIFWQRSDGTTKAERLTKPDAGTSHVPESWSSDGSHFLYTTEKGGVNSLWVFSMGSKKGEPFADVQSTRLISATFSPDGHWVAYTVTNGATNQVLVQPFPTTGEKHLVGTGARPQWSPGGKELFFYNSDRTFVVTVTTRPSFATTDPVALPFNVYGGRGPGFGRDADIMPDGKRFVAVVPSPEVAAGGGGARQLQVVINWLEELKHARQ